MMSYVNKEGEAAMTDLRKFRDILLDLTMMQHVYFINIYSNKYQMFGSLKGRYNISLQIVIGHESNWY